MIPITDDIVNTARFFQSAFTIVLALSIGEALKQFVADKAEKPEDRAIHWDRLPALLSFLLLVFSFFHGMNRYFYLAYLHAKEVPTAYGAFLIFDGVSFIVMSALFFTMSRTLSAVQWRRYFYVIIFLLLVDTLWILIAVGERGFPIKLWLWLNTALALVLGALLLFVRNQTAFCGIATSVCCALAVAITTAISYVGKWHVFFPN